MANPPPPYDNLTGISRTVMKDNQQETIANYSGNARPAEMTVNINTNEIYIGNATGALTKVIQWHYESFSIPVGATLLASSTNCPNQAWAMGPHLAMQFHIEMDQVKAQEWAGDEDPHWSVARSLWSTVQTGQQILEGIEPHLSRHQATAAHIYSTWLRTIGIH